MASNRRQVEILRKRFRVLKDWKISYHRPNEYCARCVVHPRKNRSVIYGWGRKGQEPKDFLMHEILHSAVRALTRMDKRRYKELMRAEEEFVQDLCKIIYPKI